MDAEQLISVMMTKGHTRQTAEGAIAGRGLEDLWNEYMGGSSGNGYTSPEDYANSIVDAQKKQIDEETSFLDQYTKDNPFIFDEELARQSATAEYEPYYTEVLQDYLASTDLQRQSIQGETDLLKNLYQMDTKSRAREYQMALANAEEGFAGSGMFFSGVKQRGTGALDVEHTVAGQRAEKVYGEQQAGYGRQMTSLETQEANKKRDIGREQEEAIEGGILTRENEARTGYNVPLEQTYYRKFPSSSGGALRGYTIPSY